MKKVNLTPEQLLERKALRRERAKLGLLQGFVPLLIQFGILALVIVEFLFIVGEGSILNPTHALMAGQQSVSNIEEVTNPTWVRFIYMWLAFGGTVGLMIWAAKSEGKDVKQFWLALVAGILLWQAIGECSWHFGVTWTDGVYLTFPRLESIQGTFVFMVAFALFIVGIKSKKLSWPMTVFLLSFLVNWGAHYLILGIAPFWPQSLTYHNPGKWPKIVGFVVGLHGTLMLLFRLFFKANSQRERLVLSALLYGFIGILYYGLTTNMSM